MFILYLRAMSLALTIIIPQVMTERNASLFSTEQGKGHYDGLLQAGGRGRGHEVSYFDDFDEVCFHRQVLAETLAPGSSTA
jgi:hypothetical protein